jgi:hypothetical protein
MEAVAGFNAALPRESAREGPFIVCAGFNAYLDMHQITYLVF